MGSYTGGPDRASARSNCDGEEPTSTPEPALAKVDDHVLADAFRDVHGTLLHGFTLLVSLGDDRRAEEVAAEALAAGGEQASKLSHPERAAAWLRARALRALRRGGRDTWVSGAERRASLASLGVGSAIYEGLAALSIEARAALVASTIEQFETIDVETILGASPAATRRVIAQARNRYVQAVDRQPTEPGAPAAHQEGELAQRVQDLAVRAMSAGRKRG